MKRLMRIRLVRFGFLPLIALVVLLAIAGFAAAETPTPGSTPTAKQPHPSLPELQGIPPDQLFDHFRGSQFTVTDAQGNAVVYEVTPGTVAGVTSTTLSLTPNGQTTALSFNITANTVVRAAPARGSLQALVQGDKVVVLSKHGSSDAVLIAKGSPRGMHGFGGGMMH